MSGEKCSRCGTAIEGLEPAYLLDGDEVVCRRCYDTARPACPACGAGLLRKLPKTWGKCPSCGKRFWRDAEQWLFPTTLISPGQREDIRLIRYELNDLRDSGLGPVERKTAELTAQLDGKDARAVIRALRMTAIRRSGRAGLPDLETVADERLALAANAFLMFKRVAQAIGSHGITLADMVLMLSAKPEVTTADELAYAAWHHALQGAEGDPQAASQICFELATFCAGHGREFKDSLREGCRHKLLEYCQQGVVDRVRIVAGQDACSACRKLNNKVLALADAIERRLLPCEKCTTRYDPDDPPARKGWCQCYYEVVFSDE